MFILFRVVIVILLFSLTSINAYSQKFSSATNAKCSYSNGSGDGSISVNLSPSNFSLSSTLIQFGGFGASLYLHYKLSTDANYTHVKGFSCTSPPYDFCSTKVISNLPSGTYYLFVDGNPNSASRTDWVFNAYATPYDTLTITGPTPLLISKIDTLQANCLDTGSIRIKASGGTPPYLYRITSSSSYSSINFFNGLSGGPFIVQVKDANGCETSPQSVNMSKKLDILTVVSENSAGKTLPSCYNVASSNSFNPKIQMTPKFSISGDFQIKVNSNSWTPLTQASNYTYVHGPTDLGTKLIYFIKTPSTSGITCEWSFTYDGYLEKEKINFNPYWDTSIMCSYSTTGNVKVTNITGGTPPYKFAVGYSTYDQAVQNNALREVYDYSIQPSTNIQNVKVFDANQCASNYLAISPPVIPPINFDMYRYNDLSSSGSGCKIKGKVVVSNINNGTKPYTLFINSNQGGAIWSAINTESVDYSTWTINSIADIYVPDYYSVIYVNIKDINGCWGDYREGQSTESTGWLDNPIQGRRTTINKGTATDVNFSMFVDSISCNNANDGQIRVFSINGGSPGSSRYFLVVNGVDRLVTDAAAGVTFSGLGESTTSIYVRDEHGCSSPVYSITLRNPPKLSFSYAYVLTDESCYGALDGQIVAKVSGGRGGYRYSVIPTTGTHTTYDKYPLYDTIITGIAGSSSIRYFVKVLDGNSFSITGKSCTAVPLLYKNATGIIPSLQVNSPAKLELSARISSLPKCATESGIITIVNAQGGSSVTNTGITINTYPPDTIKMTQFPAVRSEFTNNVIGSISGRIYTISLTDFKNNCTKDTTLSITAPTRISMPSTMTVINPYCDTSTYLKISFNPATINSTYIDSFYINKVLNVATNKLAPSFNVPFSVGSGYDIKVTAKYGLCASDTLKGTFSIPGGVSFKPIVSSISCGATNDGTIRLTSPTQGSTNLTGNVSYWVRNSTSTQTENYQSSTFYSNLSSGTYLISMKYKKDDVFCGLLQDSVVTINSFTKFLVTSNVSNMKCFGDTGTITISSVSGGPSTGSYQFYLAGVDNAFNSRTLPFSYKVTDTGEYTLTVRKDSDFNCFSIFKYNVTSPSPIIINTSDVKVFQPSCGVATGSIIVPPSAVSGGLSSTSLLKFRLYNGTIASGGGVQLTGSLSNSNQGSLAVGTYTLKVYDPTLNIIKECNSFNEMPITIASVSSASFTATPYSETCKGKNDGKIIIKNVTGFGSSYIGTYKLSTASTYNNVPSSDTITNLAPGTYDIIYKDASGNCQTPVTQVVVNPISTDITFDIDRFTDASCASYPSMKFKSVAGGAGGPYTYEFVSTATIGNPSHTLSEEIVLNTSYPINNSSSLKLNTEYTIRVRDKNGCLSIAAQNKLDTIGGQYKMELSNINVLPSACFSQPLGEISFEVLGKLDTVNTITSSLRNLSGYPSADLGFVKGSIYNTSIKKVVSGSVTKYGASGLYKGKYAVFISTSSCTLYDTISTLLISPDSVLNNFTYTSPLCFGSSDASIVVSNLFSNNNGVSLTVPSWTVSLDKIVNGVSTNIPNTFSTSTNYSSITISSLTSGNYVQTVKSTYTSNSYPSSNTSFGNPVNGTIVCENEKKYFTINEPTKLKISSIDSVNPSCPNSTDGKFEITATGGTPPYTYKKDNGSYILNNIFSNLSAGVFSASVKDKNNCVDNFNNFTLRTPDNITFEIDSVRSFNVSCFGASPDGQLVLKNVKGGSSIGYQYSLIHPNGNTISYTAIPNGNIIGTNLSTGIYTIKVKDNKGCEASPITMELIAPKTISLTLTQTSNNTCFYDSLATIKVVANGGPSELSTIKRYSYRIGNKVNLTGDNIEKLPSGNFSISVYDSVYRNGLYFGTCNSAPTIFNIPAKDTIKYSIKTDGFKCHNYDSASLILGDIAGIGTGSSSAYYTIFKGATNYNNKNISYLDSAKIGDVGNYNITLYNTFGCKLTKSLTLNKPDSIKILNASVVSNVVCNGESNGIIKLNTFTGGTGYTSYTVKDIVSNNIYASNSTSSVISGLSASTYKIVTYYNDICYQIHSSIYTITQPNPVTFEIDTIKSTNISCAGNIDGKIYVTNRKGGSGVYQFKIDNGNYFSFGSDSLVGSGLSKGIHNVYIRDNKLCEAPLITKFITEPDELKISSISEISKISCNGYSDGKYKIIFSGGPSGASNAVNKLYSFRFNGVTNPSNDFDTIKNVSAGSHTFTVTDKASSTSSSICISNFTYTVPVTPAITYDLNLNDYQCSNSTEASISISNIQNAVDGTYRIFDPNGNKIPTTDSSKTSVQKFNTFGTMEVRFTSDNKCEVKKSFTSVKPNRLQLTRLITSNPICYNEASGFMNFEASGGGKSYNFKTYDENNTLINSFIKARTGISVVDTIRGLTAVGNHKYTTYFVDELGCISDSIKNYTFTNPLPLEVSLSGTNPTCNGSTNGILKIKIDDNVNKSGNGPPYTYIIKTITSTLNTGTFYTFEESNSGYSAGTYTAEVRDKKGCLATNTPSKELKSVSVLDFTFGNNVRASCYNVSDGGITISPSGGPSAVLGGPSGLKDTIMYEYYVDGVKHLGLNRRLDSIITSLSRGSHTAFVKDAECISASKTFNIFADSVTFTFNSIKSFKCNKNDTAKFSIINPGGSVLGGNISSNYTLTFTESGISTTPTNDFSKVYVKYGDVNIFDIEVKDANNCATKITKTLIKPSELKVDTLPGYYSAPTCGSNTDGYATFVVNGGTPNYNLNFDGVDYALSTGVINKLISNVKGGSHNVIVTDANSCVAKFNNDGIINFTPGNDVKIDENSGSRSFVSCYDSADGIISLDQPTPTITNGYTYTLTKNGVESNNFTIPTPFIIKNLSSGNYVVKVKNIANGCFATINKTITSPANAMSFSTVLTEPSCYGVSDGKIRLFPIDTPNSISSRAITYTLIKSNGTTSTGSSNNDSITGLSGGSYRIQFQAVNSATNKTCFSNIINRSLTDGNNISFTTNVEDIKCFDSINGSIKVNLSSLSVSSIGLKYFIKKNGSIIHSNIDINNTIKSLSKGTDYSIYVQNANGCNSQEQNFSIYEPTQLTFDISSTPTSCDNVSDGVISVSNVNGGVVSTVSDYKYSSNRITFNSSNQITSLTKGTNYNVYVKDLNNCISAPQSILMNGPDEIKILIAVGDTTPPTCNNSNDGSFKIAIGGGSGSGIQYKLTNNNTNTLISDYANVGSGLISNLAQGVSYKIEAKDNKGCVNTKIYKMTSVDKINIFPTVTNISCNGNGDGKIKFKNTIGGPAGTLYSYYINNSKIPNNADSVKNLAKGDYVVKAVSDINNCVSDDVNLTVVEPTKVTFSFNISDENCYNTKDGFLEFKTSTVGTGNENILNGYYYRYEIDTITKGKILYSNDNISNNPKIPNISPGFYTVKLVRQDSCFSSQNFRINSKTLFTAKIEDSINPRCSGDANGSIRFSVSGGNSSLGNITYSVIGGVSGNGLTISNLSGGTNIEFNVSDSKGCSTKLKTSLVNTPPVTFDFDINKKNNPSCFGYSDGSIVLKNIKGGSSNVTQAYSYVRSNTPLPTNLTGYTFLNIPSDTTIIGLSSGYQYVKVRDINGCISSEKKDTLFDRTQLEILSIVTTNVDCYGSKTGKIKVVATGGTGTYKYSKNGVYFDFVDSFPNLSTGTYPIVVKDALNCVSSTQNTLVSQPTNPIVANVTFTNISCYGSNDARILVNQITGGNGSPYLYKFDSAGILSNFLPISKQLTNLEPATYVVYGYDKNNCRSTIPVINTAYNTAAVEFDILATVNSCYKQDNGKLYLDRARGGSSTGYQYSYDSGINWSNSGAFVNLAKKKHGAVARDGNGCKSEIKEITINEFSKLTIPTAVASPMSCPNSGDGKIDFGSFPSGGAGSGYAYVLSYIKNSVQKNDTVASKTSFTNLFDNNYSVYAYDSKGCVSDFQTGIIINPIQPLINTYKSLLSKVNCYDSTNAYVVISTTGGIIGATYQWRIKETNPYVSDSNFLRIPAGQYQIQSRYIDGSNICESSKTNLEITTPAKLDFDIEITDPTCNNDGINNQGKNGKIEIKNSKGGALTNYQYKLLSQPGNLVPTAPISVNVISTNLVSGTYQIQLYDGQLNSKGEFICASEIISKTLNQPASIDYIIDQTGAASTACFNEKSGKIKVISVTGGNQNYSYTYREKNVTNPNPFNPSQTISEFSGIGAGVYEVKVIDFKGCESRITEVTITEKNEILFAVNTQDNSCFNSNDGRIYVLNSTKTTAISTVFQYSLDDLNYKPFLTTESVITGVSTGSHKVKIKDTEGCESGYISLNISEPPEVITNIYKDNITCYSGNDGLVRIVATGGASNPNSYFYSFDGGISYQKDSIKRQMVAGSYAVIARDVSSGKCKSKTTNITITEPKDISFDVLANSIPFCKKELSIGEIQIIDVLGGNGGYTFSIDGGGTYNNSIAFLNLKSSTYSLIAKDIKGCLSTPKPVTIYIDNRLESAFEVTPKSCSYTRDAQIKVIASGGSTPYTYHWDNDLSDTRSNIVNNLKSGVYRYYFTDKFGCVSDTTRVTVSDETVTNLLSSFEFDRYVVNIFDPKVKVYNNSVEAKTYNWSVLGTNISSNLEKLDTLKLPSLESTFTVRLITTSDNGCYDTSFKEVKVTNTFKLPPRFVFTPNGDGINDNFTPVKYLIQDRSLVKNCTLQILDYTTLSLLHEDKIDCSWTSEETIEKANSGPYFYILKINLENYSYTDKGIVLVLQ